MCNYKFEFGFMPLSYALSNFTQKQHINGKNPAKQVCII